MRDWTRFLRHRIKKYPDSPVHTLSDSLRIYFFPLWRADLFFSGFAVEFAGYVWTVAVSGRKKLRIRKYPVTCGRGLIYELFLINEVSMYSRTQFMRKSFNLFAFFYLCNYVNREFKKTKTATATGTSLNKRFNEQNNGCTRAL